MSKYFHQDYLLSQRTLSKNSGLATYTIKMFKVLRSTNCDRKENEQNT